MHYFIYIHCVPFTKPAAKFALLRRKSQQYLFHFVTFCSIFTAVLCGTFFPYADNFMPFFPVIHFIPDYSVLKRGMLSYFYRCADNNICEHSAPGS